MNDQQIEMTMGINNMGVIVGVEEYRSGTADEGLTFSMEFIAQTDAPGSTKVEIYAVTKKELKQLAKAITELCK